jgi:hypothetical protein
VVISHCGVLQGTFSEVEKVSRSSGDRPSSVGKRVPAVRGKDRNRIHGAVTAPRVRVVFTSLTTVYLKWGTFLHTENILSTVLVIS